MANNSKGKATKNIRIPILVSENDIKAHGGKVKLSESLRHARDLNPSELQNLTNKAIKKLQDESLTKVSQEQLKK